jgi:hypothetical protein
MQVNSFELFGFDVMVDAAQRVWLLEVNSSPSLSLHTPLDRAMKPRLVADAISLLDPLPFDRAALLEVLATRAAARGECTWFVWPPHVPLLPLVGWCLAGCAACSASDEQMVVTFLCCTSRVYIVNGYRVPGIGCSRRGKGRQRCL